MRNFLLLCSIIPTTIFASAGEIDTSRYEKAVDIKVEGVITPKVAQFSTKEFTGGQTLLLDENREIIPHRWIRSYEKTKSQDFSVSDTSLGFEGTPQNLTDDDSSTYFTFHPEKNQHYLVLTFREKTDVSGIYMTLDPGIITPYATSIQGDFGDDRWTNILNNRYFSHYTPFPKVSVKKLKITLKSRHFLRLNELEISGQEKSEKNDELVFFAEEGKTYTLYTTPHFGQKSYRAGDYQPLHTDEKTPQFSLKNFEENPVFNADFDGDGLEDKDDLCPKDADSANTDKDQNGRGDMCEDPDLDGKSGSRDNCPFAYNPNQKDSDLDGIGDKCDETEDRASENMPYLLWIVFGVVALFLGFLVFRSLRN
jgi:hypothetical protein